ncbi:MAG: hypothetical protein B7Z66_12455 [Chromatiales bacterium 21-64-14]|nr:MAG: hypothetical protein B7Z66_12455 [Chromatiales bacterium 21-64-14]
MDACRDPRLKRVFAHSRDGNKGYTVMILERIRRNDPTHIEELKDPLSTKDPITYGWCVAR